MLLVVGCGKIMFGFIFEYVLPIISFGMAIMLFVKFWSARNLLDRDTIRMVKQVKTWWGESQGVKSGVSRANKADYSKGSQKVGAKIKAMVPFGLLDDLTDTEVHAYIMNEDTVKFFIKVRQLVGGEWRLPGMPDIPKAIESRTRRRDQDEVPKM